MTIRESSRIRHFTIHLAACAALAIVVIGCSTGATPASAGASTPASPSPAASAAASSSAAPSPAASPSASPAVSASPSAAGLPACLDATTYALLTDGLDSSTAPSRAAQLIAGLKAWEPPKKFDADYRDNVVAKLEAQDWPGAILLIGGGLTSGQWQVKVC